MHDVNIIKTIDTLTSYVILCAYRVYTEYDGKDKIWI